MNLNEMYPVLPGKASVRINDSQYHHSVTLRSGKLTKIQAKSLIVHYDCSPWEWTCLGGREVYLYQGDRAYPFAKGVTDVPILYLDDQVSISLEGSRDIRFHLADKIHISLNIGKARFIPKPIHRPGQVTDLARVEAIDKPFSGHTLDLEFDRVTTMPLVVGQYSFAKYVSSTHQEGQRQ